MIARSVRDVQALSAGKDAIMSREQTKGREKNGAEPGGRPDPLTSNATVRKVGKAEIKGTGPDGPGATAISDTFKKTGGI